MINSAGEFLALAKLKRGNIDISGEVLHIRELSVGERAKLMELYKTSQVDAHVFLLRCGVINESGTQLFNDEQAKSLVEASPDVVDSVAMAIMRLSGMGDDPKNA